MCASFPFHPFFLRRKNESFHNNKSSNTFKNLQDEKLNVKKIYCACRWKFYFTLFFRVLWTLKSINNHHDFVLCVKRGQKSMDFVMMVYYAYDDENGKKYVHSSLDVNKNSSSRVKRKEGKLSRLNIIIICDVYCSSFHSLLSHHIFFLILSLIILPVEEVKLRLFLNSFFAYQFSSLFRLFFCYVCPWRRIFFVNIFRCWQKDCGFLILWLQSFIFMTHFS